MNVYVVDGCLGEVYKITASGTKTQIGSGFINPNGIAVDSNGNLYVAQYGLRSRPGLVEEISPSGTITTIGSGFRCPSGVAVDSIGDLYVADAYLGKIEEVSPAGTMTQLGRLGAWRIAVDAAGNVYVTTSSAQQGPEQILPSGLGATIGQGLQYPYLGIATDRSDNVYFTCGNRILKYTPQR